VIHPEGSPVSNNDDGALVSSVYGAAHEVDGWSNALDGLSEAFGLDAHVLMRFSRRHAMPSAPELICVGGSHVSAQADQKYKSYYQAIDPRARYVRERGVDAVFSCDQHFDGAYVSRSEFYQDFLIPEGLRFCIGTCLRMPDGTDYVLGLQRSADRGPLGAQTRQRFERLLRHLGHSLQIYEQVGRERAFSVAAQAALETLPWAVLCLGDDGLYLGGNSLADSLLSEGSFVKAGRRGLCFTHARTQSDFERALRGCLRQRQPGAVLVQSTRSGAGRFTATILPAGHQSRHSSRLPESILEVAGIRAACILAAMDNGVGPSIFQLISLFELTPAEARLARAIAAGVSLESYASDNHLATSTLRSQLHAIFRKTGCNRQAELVRILGNIPALPETLLPNLSIA
jgi:DNA-binding CsgD family transcriptional regulator